jgi:hypothetical protein
MRAFKISTAALLVAVSSVAPAFAHSGVETGTTVLTVGWAVEPAFAGQPNKVEVLAEHDGEPRAGARLTVEVLFGDAKAERKTEPLRLEPRFGEPGWYETPIIPTAAGTYTFHIVGQVSEDKVDVSVTSGPDTFDEVIEPTELMFPEALPGAADLAAAGEANSAAAAKAAAAADDAQAAADMARLIAIIGLLLGALGLIFGGLSMRRRSA